MTRRQKDAVRSALRLGERPVVRWATAGVPYHRLEVVVAGVAVGFAEKQPSGGWVYGGRRGLRSRAVSVPDGALAWQADRVIDDAGLRMTVLEWYAVVDATNALLAAGPP